MDRCDRCGGKPAYRYERDVAQLTLCGKHGRAHGPRLRAHGWTTYRIAEKVSR